MQAELERYLSPNAARRLSRADPNRVRAQIAHYRWALGQGRAEGPGLLVRVIEQDWPLPAEVSRRMRAADRTRYVSGVYADLILH